MKEAIFGGLFTETIRFSCGNIKESPLQKLSEVLMIPIKGESIYSCLMDFLSEEDCEICGHNSAMKRSDLVTEPTTLIIQLKRYKFDIDRQHCAKIDDIIKCPKSFQMPSGDTFTLSLIVNHLGNEPTEGHYNMLIYDKMYDQFILLDDQTPSRCPCLSEIKIPSSVGIPGSVEFQGFSRLSSGRVNSQVVWKSQVVWNSQVSVI